MTWRYRKNKDLLEWYDAIVLAVVALALIFTFVVRVIRVDGISMNPNLSNGDRLIITSYPYQPVRGDIVVIDGYTSFDKPLVKRVIALGGDTVDIDFNVGVVSVNGETLTEPYTAEPTYLQETQSFPLTVPQGCVFVMGDNRNHSLDSRSVEVGFVDERDILGKALLRLMPISKFGVVK